MRHTVTARALAAAIAIAATTTAGCTPAAQEKPMTEYRQNPAPKQAYRLKMKIENAPGPFAEMKALAQYDVTNQECLTPPKDNPGGLSSPVPTEDVEIPLTKVSDGEYEGTVYVDQMLDQDYVGRGTCHWELMQVRVHMKATGADGETLFIPSIPSRKLLPAEEEMVYFNKISYPRTQGSTLDEPVDTGESNRTKFGPTIREDDLFTVTFTPRKEANP